MESISGAVSLSLGIVVPKLVLHELSKVSFDLEHDVKLLLLELEGSVKF